MQHKDSTNHSPNQGSFSLISNAYTNRSKFSHSKFATFASESNNSQAEIMANNAVDMSKLKQVLRMFKNGDMPNRKIAETVDLDKNRVMELATCAYIKGGIPIIITGPAGTGKSWLATALGHQACMQQVLVRQPYIGILGNEMLINESSRSIIRPTITEGMEEGAWVQLQVQTLFAKMAEDARNKKKNSLRLSQRLRGIGHAPKDFDYKKELEERF